MPEIGQTLREARMRARIDISELEAETKIRAKYLRALENEEWDLLPGPTYVKSFLRSYADALGLDGRMLVEEYKLRHERLAEGEVQPISPRSGRDRRRPRRSSGAARDILVAVVVLAILGGLIALGRVGDGDDETATAPPTETTTTSSSADTPKRRKARKPPAKPRNVTLTLVATAPVYVCLRARDKILIPAQTLAAGDKKGPFKARRFTVALGNNSVRMRVNGKLREVPASGGAIGYVVDRKGRRPLPTGRIPTCGA